MRGAYRGSALAVRYFQTSRIGLGSDKMAFYKLIGKEKSQPAKTDAEIFKKQFKAAAAPVNAEGKPLTFSGISKKAVPLVSTDDIFGVGDNRKATKSSRRDVSYRLVSKTICGVKVPKKPIEPDNCCMSGCINCVWELFNEDLQEWKADTQKAVDALIAQGDDVKELWPLGFDPPPKSLPDKYVPAELRDSAGREEAKINMPLGLQVFASLEKKLKNKTKFPMDHTLEHTPEGSSSLHEIRSTSSQTDRRAEV